MLRLSVEPDPLVTSGYFKKHRRSFWIGLALWIYGLYGFIGLLVKRDTYYFAHLSLAFALSGYFRLPVPFGEAPVLQDAVVMIYLRNSFWALLIYVSLALVFVVHGRWPQWLIFMLAALVLIGYRASHHQAIKDLRDLLAQRKQSRDPQFRQPNTGTEIPMTVAKLPLLMRLHPYALVFMPLPPHAIRHEVIELPERKIHIDVWRLHDSVIGRFCDNDREETVLSPVHTAHLATGMVTPSAPPMALMDASYSVLHKQPQQQLLQQQQQQQQQQPFRQEQQPTTPSVPTMVFVHGGAWRSGTSRMLTQVNLLHELALRGWVVVCVNYRKTWPLQLSDTVACLATVVQKCGSWGGHPANIHLAGASAGGHLVSQVVCYLAHAEAASIPNSPGNPTSATSPPAPALPEILIGFRPASLTLIYPVVDPFDAAGHTTRFPFSIPFLKCRSQQALLGWFFEVCIMGHNNTADPFSTSSPQKQQQQQQKEQQQQHNQQQQQATATKTTTTSTCAELGLRFAPLTILTQQVNILAAAIQARNARNRASNSSSNYDCNSPGKVVGGGADSTPTQLQPPEPCKWHWPRTIVVHGELDGVVPVEQGMLFISKLRDLRKYQLDYFYDESAQNFERLLRQHKTVVAVPQSDGTSAPLYRLHNNTISSQESLNKFEPTPSPQHQHQQHRPPHQFMEFNASGSGGHADEFVFVPNARHSYELSDSELVKQVDSLVIDWLQH